MCTVQRKDTMAETILETTSKPDIDHRTTLEEAQASERISETVTSVTAKIERTKTHFGGSEL